MYSKATLSEKNLMLSVGSPRLLKVTETEAYTVRKAMSILGAAAFDLGARGTSAHSVPVSHADGSGTYMLSPIELRQVQAAKILWRRSSPKRLSVAGQPDPAATIFSIANETDSQGAVWRTDGKHDFKHSPPYDQHGNLKSVTFRNEASTMLAALPTPPRRTRGRLAVADGLLSLRGRPKYPDELHVACDARSAVVGNLATDSQSLEPDTTSEDTAED